MDFSWPEKMITGNIIGIGEVMFGSVSGPTFVVL